MTTVTATTPNWNVIEPRPTSDTSFIRKVYNLFQEDNPLITKIATAALATFATLAMGYLLGSMLVFTSMVTSIVVLTGAMESQHVEDQATIAAQKRESALSRVTAMLGGANIANIFEELNLGDREFSMGAIDLQLNEIATPTHGTDKYGRHFYAIPLEKISDHSRHLIVLYEKYTTGDVWSVIGPQDLIQNPLTHEGAVELGLLMLGEHDNYRYLANAQ